MPGCPAVLAGRHGALGSVGQLAAGSGKRTGGIAGPPVPESPAGTKAHAKVQAAVQGRGGPGKLPGFFRDALVILGLGADSRSWCDLAKIKIASLLGERPCKNKTLTGVFMGENQKLSRYQWLDQQVKSGKLPNAATLGRQFEVSKKDSSAESMGSSA
jgi:hypothetical protein